MPLQSSGAINFQQIQNEFKGLDAKIQAATGISKQIPALVADDRPLNTPFPGRTPTTGTETPSSEVTLTSSTINPKTSYGSITYSNTSNDDQPLVYSIPINEYYREGIYVPDKDSFDVLINQNIPTSGQISLANFYDGIGGDIVEVISTNRENLDLSTIFGANWVDKRRKRVIINQGVIIGGTSANAEKYALKIPDTLKGGLIIINYGDIVGYGGPQGGNGGNAILVGASGPVTTNNLISNITHNLSSGIYGVVPQLFGIPRNILTPIGNVNFNSTHIAHGSGQFSVGDSIYIYNNPLSLDAGGDLIKDNTGAEPTANLCQITGQETATFTAYISSGNLTSSGSILTVISGTAPSVGMGIISGTSYKKHVITRINSFTGNVSFSGNKVLRVTSSSGFNNGMILSGQGLVAQTVVTGSVLRNPSSTAFWGSCSGTTFTVNVATSDPILPGFYLVGGTGIPSNLFVVQQLSGTTGSVGTYQISQTANGNIDGYGYLLVNKTQTITGPVDVNGIRYILNDDSGDGITTEDELISSPTSMNAIRYILNRAIDSTLDLRNKSTPFKFFTAGGTTLPGFTVTTTSQALSVLTQGQSVTISGSTATATGTNTPSINTSKFNGTWSNINKIAGSPSTKFSVTTTRIDNTYTSTNGSFPTTTTTPFTVPIRILNYGKIYGGGGGGTNSTASTNTTPLYNYLTNTYSSNTTGTVSNPNKLACKIQLFTGAGFNGTGGVGQGYNQAKTLGTSGLSNPNAPKGAYLAGYGNFTYTGGVDPYLDLISIPPNTQVNLVMIGMMAGGLNSTAAWKNVYLGSGSTLLSGGSTSGTIYTNIGTAIGTFHYLKVNNLFTFGTGNTLSFQPALNGTILRRIDNFYRASTQAATFATGWTVTNTITTPQTNPYPTDRVRIITTTNQYTYDVFFPPQLLAPKAGDGGDYGQPGQTSSSPLGAAGAAGYYITNSSIYSNVTWVNTGDVKGNVS